MSEVKLRRYHAAKWDEPFIMEQTVPGTRGLLPPLSPDEVVNAALAEIVTGNHGHGSGIRYR